MKVLKEILAHLKRLKTSAIKFFPGARQMLPVAANLSTTYKHFNAKNCIDGVSNGKIKCLCHSKRESGTLAGT